MKFSTTLIVASAAIATVSAVPIRVISFDSLVGSPFEKHFGQDERTRGKVWAPIGIPTKPQGKADDNVEGWMDLINKYALGYTESRPSEEGSFRRPHHHWHHQDSEDKVHQEGDDYFRVALPMMSSGRKPTIVHSPAEGMSDSDIKDLLIKAGVLRPSEAGVVSIKSRPAIYRGGPVREVVGGPRRMRGNGHGWRMREQRPAGQARCFFGRLFRAISAFKPHEVFFFSFTFGMGLASLFRIVFMIFILVKRSHQYVNEVPASTEGAGYPGAEYRNRREAEREELLPAYEQAISEKMDVEQADSETEPRQA